MINAIKNRATIVIPCDSPMGKGEQTAHPINCSSECPYGRGRSFCFPCMKQILKDRRGSTKTE
ncbi:MAG: hypothetical protein IKP88_17970 [Lachnospiraceae bacterium]|nr:hypothetical protein [Lachnospiraceae bacterium]